MLNAKEVPIIVQRFCAATKFLVFLGKNGSSIAIRAGIGNQKVNHRRSKTSIVRRNMTLSDKIRYAIGVVLIMCSAVILTMPLRAEAIPDCESPGSACVAAGCHGGWIICGFGPCHYPDGEPGQFVCYTTPAF